MLWTLVNRSTSIMQSLPNARRSSAFQASYSGVTDEHFLAMADDAERRKAQAAERKKEMDAELEKKKARLAELRKAKEKRLAETSGGAVITPSTETASPDQILAAAGVELPKEPVPAPAAAAEAAGGADGGDGAAAGGAPRRARATLTVCSQIAVVDIAPKINESYAKATQTVEAASSQDDDDAPPSPTRRGSMDDMAFVSPSRTATTPATDAAASADDAIRAAAATELTAQEKKEILGNPAFNDFFRKTSRVIERALVQQGFDIMFDPAGVADEAPPQAPIEQFAQFFDDKTTRGRAVTAVEWSPKFPEQMLAAYHTPAVKAHHDDPDGMLLVWSLAMPARPEFTLTCHCPITAAKFSEFNPHIIMGGTHSGQVVVWDARARTTPMLRSMLSSAAHTHPVYSLDIVGSQHAHSMITSSTDGRVCVWNISDLSSPQQVIDLSSDTSVGDGTPDETNRIRREACVTSMGFPCNDVNTFAVGCEDGNVIAATRQHTATQDGVCDKDIIGTHGGPVTGMQYHPACAEVDMSDLLLTSSVDWTVKLWSAKEKRELFSFSYPDYVYDVSWCPTKPSLFASCDGLGTITLQDLTHALGDSVVGTCTGDRALNCIGWAKDGHKISAGDSNGAVRLYNVAPSVTDADPDGPRHLMHVLRHRGYHTSTPSGDENGDDNQQAAET